MTGVVLGPRYEEQLNLLIETGHFNNRSEALRQAVEKLFATLKPEARLHVAIHAYRTRRMTVARAAEIAGVPYDDMRDVLRREGVLREGRAATPPERRGGAKRLADRIKDK